MCGLYPNILSTLGINRTINHRNNHNHKHRIMSLLYSSKISLSFSLKNRRAKHIHIPKMKNQNKSYFALRTNALIHTCCIHSAKSNNIIVVTMNIRINCNMNLD